MKILDRYIIKKLLTTFLFVVFIIVAIIVVIDITEKIGDFTKPEVPMSRILQYYMDFIPWIANLISPITVFIATVFVTANLASHTEIISMLAGGISFKRLLVPYFGAAVIIALVSFYFNGWVIPNANKSRRAFEMEYIEGKYYFTENDFHVQASPSEYLYLQRYNNTNNIGYRFTMEKIEGDSLREKLSANQIEWNDSTKKWKLKRWQRRVLKKGGEEVTYGEELDSTLVILPKDFQSQHRLWETLTLPELDEKISEILQRGLEGANIYKVEKYFRYTMPFTAFILVFIGVIVSSRKRRGGTGLQIALGFIISFIFIIFVITSRGIAEGGVIPPLIAVWIPNVVFTFVALFMYKYVPR
ncbi:MAG: LptF/LptG family permease [Cyclobacteriaceae bacterium]|nr:LptF/LptG family permease [Cyclobacteriaceae bacterium]